MYVRPVKTKNISFLFFHMSQKALEFLPNFNFLMAKKAPMVKIPSPMVIKLFYERYLSKYVQGKKGGKKQNLILPLYVSYVSLCVHKLTFVTFSSSFSINLFLKNNYTPNPEECRANTVFLKTHLMKTTLHMKLIRNVLKYVATTKFLDIPSSWHHQRCKKNVALNSKSSCNKK